LRLHPGVSADEAYVWLKGQADRLPEAQRPDDLDDALRQMADDMAAISAVMLPDELEPLFP
jgi:hypothetical protein